MDGAAGQGAKPAANSEAGSRAGTKEECMTKSWKKPTMCQVAAGMEISRYLPAEITPKK
jgi:hypothetical protein